MATDLTNSLSLHSDTVKTNPRAALYTRVSSQEQAQHGVSLPEQLERLNLWAKMEGWEVAGIYTDEGYTGGGDNRPDLQRLLHDAKAGGFNLVLVTKIDRFFRNTRLLLNYIHDLEECGVTFMAQAEGIDTSKPGIGKIILNLLGGVAEWERERIGERVKDFRSHLARKGQWSSGRTTFGYRFDTKVKELTIDPLEAEAVRFIFHTYTENQLGIIRTAEICNAKQMIVPRAGRRKHSTWTQSAIRHVLAHPAYRGGPNDSWPFKCPAIVDAQLWEQAQRQLAGNRHFRAVENHNPFTGLLRCGLCGHTLRIGYNHSTKQVWECPSRLKRLHLDGSSRCDLPRSDAEYLGQWIVNQVAIIFGDEKTLRGYIEATTQNLQKERDALERRLRPIQSNVARTQEAMKKADTMFELGRLSGEEYRARIAGLRKHIKELEQQTTDADPMLLKQMADNKIAMEHYTTLIDKLDKLFDFPEHVTPNDREVDFYAGLFVSKIFNDDLPKREPGGARCIADSFGGAAKYLRRFGLFAYIYPDKIEIKGAIRQTNVSATCRSGRCPRSR
ncbi:MAG: recombinase family protein [Chloroflexi bacterium]|nr:recombinase family protein [Chloroflexota bacterium]